jgi:hypothetical protein
MHLIRLFCSALLIVGLAGTACAFGLYVEQLENAAVSTCPICGGAIMAGAIHETAVDTIDTDFGGGLEKRGIAFTRTPGERSYLRVLVYRYRERLGGNFSVERPASVGFHVHLFDEGRLIKLYRYDETQQALSENVFRFFTFLKRGGKWVPASRLAAEGVEKALDELDEDITAPRGPRQDVPAQRERPQDTQ